MPRNAMIVGLILAQSCFSCWQKSKDPGQLQWFIAMVKYAPRNAMVEGLIPPKLLGFFPSTRFITTFNLQSNTTLRCFEPLETKMNKKQECKEVLSFASASLNKGLQPKFSNALTS